MKRVLVVLFAAVSISTMQGAEYKDVVFRNELGKGKNGHLHMPAFDSIKELTCPVFIPDPPINMLESSLSEEPYATLQRIIAAKRNGDLQGEYALSTQAFVERQKPYADAMKRLNDGWKYMTNIQFVASVKVDGFEYCFFKCGVSQINGYSAILLRLEGGKYLQACQDTPETTTRINYVHSAFVTGAWAEKGKPSIEIGIPNP